VITLERFNRRISFRAKVAVYALGVPSSISSVGGKPRKYLLAERDPSTMIALFNLRRIQPGLSLWTKNVISG
jgi:hypothetical protein